MQRPELSHTQKRARLREMARTFAPGEVVFAEGDSSREMYVLLRGRLTVKKGGAMLAEVATPGAYLGEMSTLLGVPRTATVEALSESELLQIAPDQVERFFGVSPDRGLKLAQALAGRLKQTTDRLVAAREEESTARRELEALLDELLEATSKLRDNRTSPRAQRELIEKLGEWVRRFAGKPQLEQKVIW